jgi:DMSO/TMAO reductase YedYZ heme-binding membrane subunit
LFGLRQLIPLRRWLGLYTFLYATVHWSFYARQFLKNHMRLSVQRPSRYCCPLP